MKPESAVFLELHAVTVQVGPPGGASIRALENLSLTVQAGATVGLMGASGSGKSTLLHLLCDLIRPTRGRVTRHEPGLPSLVFQFPENQLFSETVAADVGYGLREGGLDADTVQQRIDSALQDVGLPPEHFRDRVPFQLSGGERRRVALAGALAQRRALLLLDEPTLALDREGVQHLERILGKRRAAGETTWIASHDADFLAATCSHLLVLDAGHLVYDGDAAAYWADPQRAATHGVRLPRRALQAHALRQRGVTGLVAHPSEDELFAALDAVLGRRR